MIKRYAPVLLLLFLCGCFEIKDELTIQPDGSGTIRIETKSTLAPEIIRDLSGQITTPLYPPCDSQAAHAFFPEKAFTVKLATPVVTNGVTTTVIDASFKDINALLASPYGRAHDLRLIIENGVLSLKAISGLEGLARIAEVKDDTGTLRANFASLGEIRKKTNEMRFEFRVTLPNTVSTANGSRNAKSVTWVVERAKVKNSEDYARQLSNLMEATCPADSIKMMPVTPPRLVSTAFKDLQPGPFAASTGAPDPKKVEQAAKFVPLALHVTRSLDLTGEGSIQQNSAELIGQLIVANEFAPQKWGESTLEEAVDAQGNNLKRSDASERTFESVSYGGESEAKSDEDAASKEQKRMLRFQFQPPDWKVKEIAKIKASVDLQYFSGSQLLTISNAIPTNWITKQERIGSFAPKPIEHPKLSEIGLSLQFGSGLVQNGVTALNLSVEGSNGIVSEIQVFDASGRPWPSVLQQYGSGESGSLAVVVLGQPQPPLSLALVVSGGATTVKLPILLEHIPVAGK